MAGKTDFDHQAAHKYFSTHCFNRAWDLIEKSERTPDEAEEMIRLSLASQYHWSQREDASSKTASIGFWQTSRIYALLGLADNARRFPALSCAALHGTGMPFGVGLASCCWCLGFDQGLSHGSGREKRSSPHEPRLMTSMRWRRCSRVTPVCCSLVL